LLDAKPGDIKIRPDQHPEFPTRQPTKTMNFRILTGLAAIVCLSLASCYPYNEKPRNKKANKGPEKVLTPEEQQKLKDDEARKKAEEELKKKQEEAQKTNPNGGLVNPPPGGGDGPGITPPPPKRNEYPVAVKVPGKNDQVISPYNSKVVLITDEQGRPYPSGTLMQDPTFPASEKKYFRVP
jgi:hypothetical protein